MGDEEKSLGSSIADQRRKEQAGLAVWSSEERDFLRRTILSWFAEHRRPLPWRREYDPYQVWVSEIMAQQTRMERVVSYFSRWMALFPDPATLARAGQRQVLTAWEGMGYYARARNLHRAARMIMTRHQGRIPDRLDQLLALPGIGPYTAAAILSIGFQQPVPLVDANVQRLFTRLLDLEGEVGRAPLKGHIHDLAADLLPPDQARDFNQGLMEYGALVCTPRNPDCDHCVLAHRCRACLAGTVHQRPRLPVRGPTIDITMATVLIIDQDRVYIQQRLPDDVWGGLWEFPGGQLEEGETPARAARREVREETGLELDGLRPLASVVHHYTRYRVTLHGFLARPRPGSGPVRLTAASQYRWVRFSALSDFPFPAGHRRLIDVLFRRFPPQKKV